MSRKLNNWAKCIHCCKFFLSGGCVKYYCGAVYCAKCDDKLFKKSKN